MLSITLKIQLLKRIVYFNMIGLQKLEPPISREYQRWKKVIGNDDPYDGPKTIGIKEVLRAHFLLANYFFIEGEGIGGIGPRNMDLFHSALARQSVSLGGTRKWTTPLDICATLFFGLVKNHPFHDGNKRTALLILFYHLQKIGKWVKTSEREFEKLTVDVAANQIPNSFNKIYKAMEKKGDPIERCISHFLARNTRDVDKRYCTITYRELNTIINKHGFEMLNPKDNKIDIIQHWKKKKIFGLLGEKDAQQRIGVINFPGWTKAVDKRTLKNAREITRLVPEKGYDSQTFFKDIDPLETLIDSYSAPLKRLADK